MRPALNARGPIIALKYPKIGNSGGKVVPGGFEPPSPAPKAGMIDLYTTGL